MSKLISQVWSPRSAPTRKNLSLVILSILVFKHSYVKLFAVFWLCSCDLLQRNISKPKVSVWPVRSPFRGEGIYKRCLMQKEALFAWLIFTVLQKHTKLCCTVLLCQSKWIISQNWCEHIEKNYCKYWKWWTFVSLCISLHRWKEGQEPGVHADAWVKEHSSVLSYDRFRMRRWRMDPCYENWWHKGKGGEICCSGFRKWFHFTSLLISITCLSCISWYLHFHFGK